MFELINNAARHAFSDGEGEIRAELLWADPFVECRIIDNGSTSGEVQSGHGLKIVDALSKSLGGQFAQTFGSQGSRAILVSPATMSNAAAIEGGVFTAPGRGEDIMPPARRYARCEPVEITSTLISSLAGRS